MARPVVADDDVFSLSDAELRFREACQFYSLFLAHAGPAATATGNRFLWMCYADAFFMAVASLKDLTPHRAALNAEDKYRLIVTLRNLTVHSVVAGSPGAGGVISRNIYANVGGGQGRDNEEPVITSAKLDPALSAYESRLRAEPLGRGRTRWDAERRNVEAARRWSVSLASSSQPRCVLSDLFLETIQLVGNICGFTIPPL